MRGSNSRRSPHRRAKLYCLAAAVTSTAGRIGKQRRSLASRWSRLSGTGFGGQPRRGNFPGAWKMFGCGFDSPSWTSVAVTNRGKAYRRTGYLGQPGVRAPDNNWGRHACRQPAQIELGPNRPIHQLGTPCIKAFRTAISCRGQFGGWPFRSCVPSPRRMVLARNLPGRHGIRADRTDQGGG